MSASTSDIKWEKHEDVREGVGQKKNRADSFLQEELTARGGVAVVNLQLQNRVKRNIENSNLSEWKWWDWLF